MYVLGVSSSTMDLFRRRNEYKESIPGLKAINTMDGHHSSKHSDSDKWKKEKNSPVNGHGTIHVCKFCEEALIGKPCGKLCGNLINKIKPQEITKPLETGMCPMSNTLQSTKRRGSETMDDLARRFCNICLENMYKAPNSKIDSNEFLFAARPNMPRTAETQTYPQKHFLWMSPENKETSHTAISLHSDDFKTVPKEIDKKQKNNLRRVSTSPSSETMISKPNSHANKIWHKSVMNEVVKTSVEKIDTDREPYHYRHRNAIIGQNINLKNINSQLSNNQSDQRNENGTRTHVNNSDHDKSEKDNLGVNEMKVSAYPLAFSKDAFETNVKANSAEIFSRSSSSWSRPSQNMSSSASNISYLTISRNKTKRNKQQKGCRFCNHYGGKKWQRRSVFSYSSDCSKISTDSGAKHRMVLLGFLRYKRKSETCGGVDQTV